MSYYDWSQGKERGSIEDDLKLLADILSCQDLEHSAKMICYDPDAIAQLRRHIEGYHGHKLPTVEA